MSMKLVDFLKVSDARVDLLSDPKCSLLHDFFESTSMNLVDGYKLSYSRRPDFFEYNNALGQDVFTLLCKDDSGEMYCVASLVKREISLEGSVVKAVYVSDLRYRKLANGPRFSEFLVFYGKLISELKHIEEFSDCNFVFTGILESNKAAIRSLIRANATFQYAKFGTLKSTFLSTPLRFLYRQSERGMVFSVVDIENAAARSEISSFLDHFHEKTGVRDPVKFRVSTPWIVLRRRGSIVSCLSLQRSQSKTVSIEATQPKWRFLLRLLFGNSDSAKRNLPLVFVSDWCFTEPVPSFPWGSLSSFLLAQKLVSSKEILVAPCAVSTRISGFNLVPEVRTSLFEVLSAEGKPFFRNGVPSVYLNANGL